MEKQRFKIVWKNSSGIESWTVQRFAGWPSVIKALSNPENFEKGYFNFELNEIVNIECLGE